MNRDQRDKEMLKAFERGREEALIQLLRLYSVEIWNFAHTRLSNATDADDVLSEVLIAICRNPQIANQIRNSISGWIWGIARNKCADKLKARRVNRLITGSEELLEAVFIEQQDPLLIDELKSKIRNAIQTLPAAQRKVAELRHLKDLQLGDIYPHFPGRKENSIRADLNKANRKIIAKIKEYRSEKEEP